MLLRVQAFSCSTEALHILRHCRRHHVFTARSFSFGGHGMKMRKIDLLNEPLVGMKQRQEEALFFQCPLKIHGYDCPCRTTCTKKWHENMLVQVAMAMQPAVYVPREEPPASRLCTSGRLEPRTGRLVPFVPSRVCSGPALLQM